MICISIIYKINERRLQNIEINQVIMSESSFENAIVREAKGEVVYSHYNDFDSDGTYEMFAIVGSKLDDVYSDGMFEGEIWFANQKETRKIEDSKHYWREPQIYLFEDDMFITFDEYYYAYTVTYIWGVKDSQPFQQSLISNGFEINNYNEIEITNSSYDGIKTIYDDSKVLPDDEIWTLHTYNKYYYYWNGSSFREYGAIEITKEELLLLDGTGEILDYISNLDATINQIFYRNNNVIQINYEKEERVGNATVTYYNFIMFRYEGNKIELENCDMGEGIILKALNTSLAEYPDGFDLLKSN